jgi:hypothetical protein
MFSAHVLQLTVAIHYVLTALQPLGAFARSFELVALHHYCAWLPILSAHIGVQFLTPSPSSVLNVMIEGLLIVSRKACADGQL